MTDYITRTCPICGKEYQTDSKRLQHGRSTTCSRECSYALRSLKLRDPSAKHSRFPSPHICKTCGKEFMTVHALYCSPECRPHTDRKRVTIICETCGKPFEVQAYRAAQAKYCSRQCHNPAHYVECVNCGKRYKKSPSAIHDINLCSPECLSQYFSTLEHPERRSRITVHCVICGKAFEREPNQIKRNIQVYCSRECFAEGHRERMAGDKNPSWRGGFDPYYGPNWSVQRRRALQRDNKTCQRCGSTKRLHVHHIKPLREFNRDFEAANDLNNLITLCSSCHKAVEWQQAGARTDAEREAAGQLTLFDWLESAVNA